MLVCVDPRKPQAPFGPIGLKRGALFCRHVALADWVSVVVRHKVIMSNFLLCGSLDFRNDAKVRRACHAGEQRRLEVAPRRRPFGLRTAIGYERKQRGLLWLGQSPCLKLLSAQFA